MRLHIPGRPLCDMAALFLLVDGIARLPALHALGLNVWALLLTVGGLFLLFLARPGLVDRLLLVLGFSFPLYCYQSYTAQSQVFEFLGIVLGLLLWFRLRTGGRIRTLNSSVAILLACCVLLALASLALFPVTAMARLFGLWGWFDFSSALFTAPPDEPLYSLAAADRLLLFFWVALLLSSQDDGRTLYGRLFQGAALGGVAAALLGVLNQYGLVDLAWLRPQFHDPSGVPRLHSVTGNPGWFAQYLVGSLPFVILLPGGRFPLLLRYLGLALLFLLCGAALLLTASRTSWLIFPCIVVACSLALSLPDRGACALSAGLVRKAVLRTCGLLLLLGLISTGLVLAMTGHHGALERTGTARIRFIMERMGHVFIPQERSRVWRQSVILAQEGPLFGLGYEGYKWHQKVMTSVPESAFARNRQTSNDWDTPHSFPLQIFISNGLAGLVLWSFLFVCVLALLWWEFRRSCHRVVAALLISMASLLLYGLTQSLQYVPLIWFLLFLGIGYALTVPDKVLSRRLRRLGSLCSATAPLLVVAAVGYYLSHAQSRYLALRYGLPSYAAERGPVQYAGFYPREQWGDDGVFRWTGPRAEMRLPYGGMVEFTLVANTPAMAADPVVVDVTLNSHPLDRYTFWGAGTVRRAYFLPTAPAMGANTLMFTVSRTWSPRRVGLGTDTRNLGIAISAPRPLDGGTLREAGFFGVEADHEQGRVLLYRWTGRSAFLDPAAYGPARLRLLLRAGQPFLERNPVTVCFIQERKAVGSITLSGPGWSEVVLPPTLRRDRPLMLLVSRTWNPRRQGYGSDGRDLGVAVAPLPLTTGRISSPTTSN